MKETEFLKPYFEGMKKSYPDRLKVLASVEGWKRKAQQEIDRRAADLLGDFPDDTLAGIAEGKVNVTAAIVEVLIG